MSGHKKDEIFIGFFFNITVSLQTFSLDIAEKKYEMW